MQTADNDLRYDLVIFDVGGTLLGFHDYRSFQQFLAGAGLPASDEEARRFHRWLMSVISAERDSAQGLGADGQELYDWWYGVFAKTWPDRLDLAEEMLRWLFAGRFDRLFDDVMPTLKALQQLGLRMGVISNFGTHLEEVLQHLGLRLFFDFLVVSAVEGLAKPDPHIFDVAASRAGAPRERLLYVGDHYGDDIQGARAAGIDAVLIDRAGKQCEALCPRIGSLLDLVHYVHCPMWPARAILLDMDGVVLDSLPAHLLTWQQTLAPLGIDLSADDLFPLEGIPTEPTVQQLTEQLLGRACSDEEARRLAATKRALFRQIYKPALVPGMGPLLHDLSGRGYRLGLVTGSARSVVDESLAPTGVAGLFEVMVTGDQTVRGKPDPEPYQLAATHLGLSPAECLAVENAPLGIQSAKAAGMSCVALETTLPAARLPAADLVFPDVQALRAWLLESY
jgi:beta-phosphoglucomutase